MEPAENDEGLQEEQKQYASVAPRHRTGRILCYGVVVGEVYHLMEAVTNLQVKK